MEKQGQEGLNALIIASVSEEVSRHLFSSKSDWEELNKLKDLYDSHSELEIIQLLMNLFNLELKDNDPMKLASEIRAIFHDIDATGVKVDTQLTAFIKALYLTYSHYLESLQASGQMKYMAFEALVEKLGEKEKAFGKEESKPIEETLCLAHKAHKSKQEFTKDENRSRGQGRGQRGWYIGRGGGNI